MININIDIDSTYDRLELAEKIIEYLLPTWEEGDLIAYDHRIFKFQLFSTNMHGEIFCHIKDVNADPNDFFNVSVIPLRKVLNEK